MEEKKETRGRKPAGGPRVHMRFQSQAQLDEIQKAIDFVKADPLEKNISLNQLMLNSTLEKARKIIVKYTRH